MILPEDKLLKRYIDSRKKEYLEFVKQSERSQQSSALEFKQTATRITIEGDHICLFMIKRVVTAASEPAHQDHFQQAAARSSLYEIDITPILNAPYQLTRVTIPLQDLKLALTYRYLYERRAIRLVTRTSNAEYLINFKTQRHKDKALKTLLRLAAPYLD